MNPTPPAGETASSPNTPIRDARLSQALRHMPDAHLQPDPQIRNAVLQAARNAVATPPAEKTARWRVLWHWLLGQPGHRMPLTGAVASLLVASFITLMWFEQEVPDAAPEHLAMGPAPTASRQVHSDAATMPVANQVPVGLVEKEKSSVAADRPMDVQGATSAVAVRLEKRSADVATVHEAVVERFAASPAPAPASMQAPPPPKALAAPAESVVLSAQVREGMPRREESLSRADREAAPDFAVVIWLDGQQRTLTPLAGRALLAALHALPVQRDGVAAAAIGEASGNAVANATASVAKAKTDSAGTEGTLTVQTNTGEFWLVSAGSARTFGASAGRHAAGAIADTAIASTTRAITPAQWAQLRALAASPLP